MKFDDIKYLKEENRRIRSENSKLISDLVDALIEIESHQSALLNAEAQNKVLRKQRNWLASHFPETSSAFNGDLSKLDAEVEKVASINLEREGKK